MLRKSLAQVHIGKKNDLLKTITCNPFGPYSGSANVWLVVGCGVVVHSLAVDDYLVPVPPVSWGYGTVPSTGA
jgi:hypothetical protein